MKNIILTSISLILISLNTMADDNLKSKCFLQEDKGEVFAPESGVDTSCMLEQLMVDLAVDGLTALPMKKYCADNADRGRADGTVQKIGYACRGLVRYKDINGNLSEKIFEEWFILPENKSWRGLKILGDDGLYRVSWQEPENGTNPEVGSEIIVNSSNPRQSNMKITFHGVDRFYPKFDIHYAYGSTDILATHGIYEYSNNKVTILKYEPVLSEDGTFLKKAENGDFLIDIKKEIHPLAYILVQ